jgi:hypothetical protein
MITQDEAHAIAETFANRADPSPDLKFVVVRIQERDAYWLLHYDSAAHVASGNFKDAIAGNGPLLVSKSNGAVVAAGSAAPLADRIAEAAEVLRSLTG